MSQLFICESSKKAKSIYPRMGKFSKRDGYVEIEGGDIVTWARGHLYELVEPHEYDARYKKWCWEDLPIIPTNWRYRKIKGSAAQVSVIGSLLKNAHHVVIATDKDREGEAVARQILAEHNWSGQIDRMLYSSLAPREVDESLASLVDGSTTYNKYPASLARSRSDWIVGMTLSRALTLKGDEAGIKKAMSIGRVQTPTLALIVARDRAIEAFRPIDFYALSVELTNGITAVWQHKRDIDPSVLDEEGRITDRSIVESVEPEIAGAAARVEAVSSKTVNHQPPLPYSLAELQKDAGRFFGYSMDQTLSIAQSLYETRNLARYPRTDSRALPLTLFDDRHELIDQCMSHLDIGDINGLDKDYQGRAWQHDIGADAHEANIPVLNPDAKLDQLDEGERNVYELLARRYLAQFCIPSTTKESEIVFKIGPCTFRAKAVEVINKTWELIEKDAKSVKSVVLPSLSEGDEFEVQSTTVSDKKTTPPKPFSEGEMGAVMANIAKYTTDPDAKKILRDTDGIGTSATRAEIIKTLKARGYIVSKAGKLRSTPLGELVVDSVPAELCDPVTTALMERQLSAIEAGATPLVDFMATIDQYVEMMLDAIRNKSIDASRIEIKKCPKCAAPLTERKGPRGRFLSCSGYPECDYTDNGRKKTVSVPTDIDCEECGDKMVKRKGKKFFFLGCSNYPKCTAMKLIN